MCWSFWDFSKKKVFGECESQIFVNGDKNAGRGVKVGGGFGDMGWGTKMILIG